MTPSFFITAIAVRVEWISLLLNLLFTFIDFSDAQASKATRPTAEAITASMKRKCLVVIRINIAF
jgi:hypothetical protein